MGKKSQFITLLTLGLSTVSIILLVLLIPPNLSSIITFASQNKLLLISTVIIYRVLAIVIPPLPGGAISIALIPVFGWQLSFLVSSVSVLIGTSISFFLARKFREPLVKNFIPLQQLHKWETKLSQKRKLWAFLVIRFTTGPILDFISYAAGLSKISFKNFFLATTITLIPDAFFYYLGETAYKVSSYLALALLVVFFTVFLILKKKKFFETNL